MSASPSQRDSAREHAQRPSTPDHKRTSIARTGSVSVAPRSEYLRNALQARRAQGTSTPTALDMRVPPSTTPKPPEPKPVSVSPDGFDEFELTDEHTRPVSPIRRRRPSDVGVPRSKTSRQLTEEIEKLKDNLMTSNMRVELLKKNNSELQHISTQLTERVEELEPLEEENHELQHENNNLMLKTQHLEEEMERLKDDNDELRKSNEEMLEIYVDCSSHFETQEIALQEAVDTIFALEEEKAVLAGEVHKLKERVTLLEDGSTRVSTLYDGSPRAPSIVYSIDESRPSTSHFDSDYYSQPDSPQVKNSKESIVLVQPGTSARSKKFLEQTKERRRSAKDIVNRMSTASMSALRMASLKHAEDIPEVPELQVETPTIVEHVVSDRRSSRPAKQPRGRLRESIQSVIQDALEISPSVSESAPTPVQESLRRTSRSSQSTGYRSSSDSRPSSSHARTPTIATRFRQRRPSTEASPRVPSRRSSKQAHTNSSNEQLFQRDQQPPRHRRSESDVASAETPRATSEEWASIPPPSEHARSSIISSSSLTSDADLQDKDHWWRSIQPLTQQQQQTHHQPTHYQAPPHLPLHRSRPSESGLQSQAQHSPTLTRSRTVHPDSLGQSARIDTAGPSSAALNALSRRTRTQPSTPAASSTYMEKDFMFNGHEDVETFMRKAKAKLSGRK
ncbi:hypothetical protein HBH51_080440 [Parastagonospora nodorum]|nr:hypothetical protein HBH51_080440 [Parastagonospora nodorum]